MTAKERRIELLVNVRHAQMKWMKDHGDTLAGYIARYGSVHDHDHYGAGGEAIYAADLAELIRLEEELAYS